MCFGFKHLDQLAEAALLVEQFLQINECAGRRWIGSECFLVEFDGTANIVQAHRTDSSHLRQVNGALYGVLD